MEGQFSVTLDKTEWGREGGRGGGGLVMQRYPWPVCPPVVTRNIENFPN